MHSLGNSPHKTVFESELATSTRMEAAREPHGLRQDVCHPQVLTHSDSDAHSGSHPRARLQALICGSASPGLLEPIPPADGEKPPVGSDSPQSIPLATAGHPLGPGQSPPTRVGAPLGPSLHGDASGLTGSPLPPQSRFNEDTVEPLSTGRARRVRRIKARVTEEPQSCQLSRYLLGLMVFHSPATECY